MKIDKEELLRRLRISEEYNSDIPAWVLKTIEGMLDADRDCETCTFHTENGCTVWECRYMPDNLWSPPSKKPKMEGLYLIFVDSFYPEIGRFKDGEWSVWDGYEDDYERIEVVCWMPYQLYPKIEVIKHE